MHEQIEQRQKVQLVTNRFKRGVNMRVLVSGSSGLIGSALVAELTLEGHDVYTLGRSPSPGGKSIVWNIENKSGSLRSLESIDGVIHLAGEPIGAKRWTDAEKKRIVSSRISGTAFLSEMLKDASLSPAVFVAASAIGFYGNRDDEILTESSPAGSGYLASLVEDWERESLSAQNVAARVVMLRTGIVLSGYGGALAKQLPLFKYGLGAALGDGRQFMSWIHLEDEVRAIITALTDNSISGPVNLVAPKPVTNLEFSKTIARVLGRPMLLKVPSIALEIGLGKEFANELLLASQRVAPTVLEEKGFQFLFPQLENALSDILR